MYLFERLVEAPSWLHSYEGSSIVIDLNWQLQADLDLGVVYQDRDTDNQTLLYYGRRGSRASYPYLHLGSDATGDGRTKLRREHLVATRLDEHQQIDVLVWDHESLLEGVDSAFSTDIELLDLCATDGQNFRYPFKLASHRAGNCIHAVRIRDGAFSLVDNIATLSTDENPEDAIVKFVQSAPEIAA